MTFARAIGVLGSLVFPGLGAGLTSKLLRPTVWALVGGVSACLIVTSVWWLPVTVVVRIASAVDAWRLRKQPVHNFEPAVAALLLGVIGWLVTGRLLDAYRIPSESMIPTIEVGDRVYVDTLHRASARGEVVFFHQPCSGVMFVKRVIGLPGDRIAVRGGVLWRNGRVVDMRGGRAFPDPDKPFSPRCGPQSKQPLGALNAAGEYVVPAGGVFVMGDNRSTANDSRYWGIVPTSAIIGRAVGVYWPPVSFGDLD